MKGCLIDLWTGDESGTVSFLCDGIAIEPIHPLVGQVTCDLDLITGMLC